MRIYEGPNRFPEKYLQRIESPADLRHRTYTITYVPQTEEEAEDVEQGRPTTFKPSWPPQGKAEKPVPKAGASKEFKKPVWPPQDEVVATKPSGSPQIPNEENDLENEENTPPQPQSSQNQDGSGNFTKAKPKKRLRDYTEHFNKNRNKNPLVPAYPVPAGIEYEVVERGIDTFQQVILVGEHSVITSAEKWQLQQRLNKGPEPEVTTFYSGGNERQTDRISEERESEYTEEEEEESETSEL